MALTQIKADGLAADLIDETKLADNSIDSEHYNDGSIDHEHLANDAVDGDIIADNAVALAHMAHGTDGQIITYDASGAPVAVGPGTDGQVLTSTGAGSPPAFEAIPASGTATNLIINGAMQVAQRGTSSTDTGFKTLDRFAYYKAGTQTQSQAAIASSTSGPYAAGFRKCYKVVNGSNTAGNTDAATFQYSVEDQDLACSGWNHTDPNSKITLSFWARSSVGQTFYFQIRTKHGTNQGYWSSYALSADTWTKVTKTIPGYANIDLANDAGNGMNLAWNTYYGTDNTGSGGLAENTWGAFAGGTSTPDQTVTWQNTNTATFELTGVQLETGDTATDFAHKPFRVELIDCLRYFEKSYPYGNPPGDTSHDGAYQCASSQVTGSNTTGRTDGARITYRVHKRNNPTATIYDLAGNSGYLYRHSYGSAGANSQSADAGNWSDTGFNLYSEGSHNATGWQAHWTADSEL